MKRLAVSVREYVDHATSGSKADIETLIREFKNIEKRIEAIPHGPKGERGEKGDPGEAIKGEKGDPGESIVGERGLQGERGEPGESIKGDKGDKGEPGESIIGQRGLQGERGLPGESIRGERGEKGEKGDPGETIIGPKGDQGIPGESIKGERGEKGEDGQSVSVEAVRLMVLDELRKELALIPKAKDGRDGLDALQLEILPGIDPARTYLRGTFAKNNGGLVRYKEDTWEVITNGIASIGEEKTDDPREIRIVITQTNGEQCVIERHIPLPLYWGVYGDDMNVNREWMRGDTASHGGSVWHCNVNGAQSRPGTPGSREWTLMVKEGRRGKDAEPPKSNGNGGAPVRLK